MNAVTSIELSRLDFSEMSRLEALRCYAILDSPPEPEFDDICHLVSRICNTPIAVITLLDLDRQWFKSVVGLELSETSREVSFCNYAIQGQGIFQVKDTRKDARFMNNPLVLSDPGIRFYAGFPLVSAQGYALGALAVVDYVPRQLDPLQAETLKTLAQQVAAQLELRRKKIEMERLADRYERLERFRSGQAAIMEGIATGAPITETMEAVVKMLEQYDSKFLCSVLLLDETEMHLRHGAAPSLPQAYIQAIDGVRIGPNVGSCGTAAYERRFVAVEDIATDPLWRNYHELALVHGLRACWSMPIFSGAHKVLGTFAVYARSPSPASPEVVELVQSCSHIISVAIESQRVLQTLRDNEESVREQASLLDETQDAILTRTIDGQITFWNKPRKHYLVGRKRTLSAATSKS